MYMNKKGVKSLIYDHYSIYSIKQGVKSAKIFRKLFHVRSSVILGNISWVTTLIIPRITIENQIINV